ncbi:MAG TPA: pilus assembly protein TadG-related protein [Microbacteriaceae bacterium]|nr:pilus assembly protein TadG-related protein [Microbacteriaceae bacterium]
MRHHPERGSTVPLIVCACTFALAVIWVCTAATSLYITRKQLLSVADAAALAAAESFSLADVTLSAPGTVTLTLNDRDVRLAAERSVSASPTKLTHLELQSATTPDGVSARVVVAADWAPPLIAAILPAHLSISAESTARTAFSTR